MIVPGIRWTLGLLDLPSVPVASGGGFFSKCGFPTVDGSLKSGKLTSWGKGSFSHYLYRVFKFYIPGGCLRFQPSPVWSFICHCYGEMVYLGGGFIFFFVSPRSLVVSWSNLTVVYFFQMGWFNHQPVYRRTNPRTPFCCNDNGSLFPSTKLNQWQSRPYFCSFILLERFQSEQHICFFNGSWTTTI